MLAAEAVTPWVGLPLWLPASEPDNALAWTQLLGAAAERRILGRAVAT
ncbi:MAG: hypothetical protein ACYC9Z_00035 [Casimicrobiaceae bacterium]